MDEFSVSGITSHSISENGQRVVLNLIGSGDTSISLKLDSMTLQKIMHDCGFVLTKARQLASAKPNFVVALRPAKFRADLIPQTELVGVVYALANGLEHTYALLPDEADALAQQMQDAAKKQRQIKPKKESRH
jgi:hypothetical protein